MTTRGHHGLLLLSNTVSAGTALYNEIIADAPEWYVRLNETSGTNVNNETGGTDGTYGGAVILNQPPIYTGGPQCAGFQLVGSSYAAMGAGFPVSTGSITMMAVIRPTTTSGVQSIISKDDSAGGRSFQWRLNGTSLEWVKIIGTPQGVTKTSAVTAGIACILHVTVSSGGAVEFFKNGVSIHTGSVSPANYVTANGLRIGYAQGPAAGFNGYMCDCAGFGSVLSSARIAAHAAAGGF
jgi:hypothetical protein